MFLKELILSLYLFDRWSDHPSPLLELHKFHGPRPAVVKVHVERSLAYLAGGQQVI